MQRTRKFRATYGCGDYRETGLLLEGLRQEVTGKLVAVCQKNANLVGHHGTSKPPTVSDFLNEYRQLSGGGQAALRHRTEHKSSASC